MDTLTWKTARIVSYPDGDIWAVVSADHLDNPADAQDTVAAAGLLMRQTLPDGGLVAEYLFLEQLERAALAAEIAAMQAQRDFLRCSTVRFALSAARARIESVRLRYISDTMTSLDALKKARGGPAFGPGEAFLAIRVAQTQLADTHTTPIIPWEMVR